ncbi:hypothetical protein B0H11DRAFT_2244476 [Mycena galericulata]|nr:hypothetical protein B0H11DRAFT_2244476 [Mycena galericulata]
MPLRAAHASYEYEGESTDSEGAMGGAGGWRGVRAGLGVPHILSIMKASDIPSEGALKLLAELLDLDAPGPYEEGGRNRNAEEHFAHVGASLHTHNTSC